MSTFVSLPLVLYPSRWRSTLLLLISLAFVAGGIWLVQEGKPFGYVCIGLLGLGVPLSLAKLHPRVSYLELRKDGFTFRSLFRTHRVPWAQVRSFGVMPIGRERLVAWNYVPSQPVGSRSAELSRQVTGYQAMLPDSYGMRPQELADLLSDLCGQHGGSGFEPPSRRRPAL